MIDHVTYTVADLDVDMMNNFMATIGFMPFEISGPQAVYESRINQQWYTNGGECDIHIVENEEEIDIWRWGHICISGLSKQQLETARKSGFCSRDNDTGRFWLVGPCGIRVEVRS